MWVCKGMRIKLQTLILARVKTSPFKKKLVQIALFLQIFLAIRYNKYIIVLSVIKEHNCCMVCMQILHVHMYAHVNKRSPLLTSKVTFLGSTEVQECQ